MARAVRMRYEEVLIKAVQNDSVKQFIWKLVNDNPDTTNYVVDLLQKEGY